jgi:O-succinylbenzoate synthase
VIERLHLHEIEVRFSEPLVTPDGVILSRRSILVGAEAEGLIGWGEAPAFPSRTWGTADAAWDALERPGVLHGEAPLTPIASAALQAAASDLEARLAGVPLHRHLGAEAHPIGARYTIGLMEDPADLVDRVRRLRATGMSAIKVKIRPGWDSVHIAAVRNAFPTIDISVDANATYRDPEDPVFEALAEARVGLIEQPFPTHDLASHAALRRRKVLSVCLDEAIRSRGDARQIISAKAADVLSVKVNRLGLEAGLAILELAFAEGIGVKVGGTFDTSIGRRLLLGFAMLGGVIDAEIAPPSGYLESDIADYPEPIRGQIRPDDRPGIGVDPDHERLADLEVRRTVVGG